MSTQILPISASCWSPWFHGGTILDIHDLRHVRPYFLDTEIPRHHRGHTWDDIGLLQGNAAAYTGNCSCQIHGNGRQDPANKAACDNGLRHVPQLNLHSKQPNIWLEGMLQCGLLILRFTQCVWSLLSLPNIVLRLCSSALY